VLKYRVASEVATLATPTSDVTVRVTGIVTVVLIQLVVLTVTRDVTLTFEVSVFVRTAVVVVLMYLVTSTVWNQVTVEG